MRFAVDSLCVGFQASALSLGTINKNDIVVDDIGQRYQVYQNTWTNFGYRLLCVEMAM